MIDYKNVGIAFLGFQFQPRLILHRLLRRDAAVGARCDCAPSTDVADPGENFGQFFATTSS
jgi:hypothetical protein